MIVSPDKLQATKDAITGGWPVINRDKQTTARGNIHLAMVDGGGGDTICTLGAADRGLAEKYLQF